MLKIVVSALSVASTASALRPEPSFTLRDGEQMARPLPVRGQPLPSRHGPALVDPMDLEHMDHPAPRPPRGDPRYICEQ
jgi:hypothetical protein